MDRIDNDASLRGGASIELVTVSNPDSDSNKQLLNHEDESPLIRPQLRFERTNDRFVHLHTAVEYLATPAAIRTHELMDRSLFDGQQSVIMGVTSAVAGEGKSTIALHLAMSIAKNSFKKVCLIDLSLSRSTLADRLGCAGTTGVVDVLDGESNTVTTIQSDECKGFYFIPAGKDPENPNRIARSPYIAEVFAACRELYDVVIVELPSVASGNVLPIKPYIDAMMMVVWSGVTPREVVHSSLEKLGRDKVMGVVMNRSKDHVPTGVRSMFRI